MAEEQERDDDLLKSPIWSRDHLLTLGRIIELTATHESYLRLLLGRALLIRHTGLESDNYIDAVFLGSRTGDLARRLSALSKKDGLPEWVAESAVWADRAAALAERRDSLVHRPPVTIIGLGAPGTPEAGMSPARRNQKHEVIHDQATSLLRDLVASAEQVRPLLRASFDWYAKNRPDP